jgi:hypothetical protein
MTLEHDVLFEVEDYQYRNNGTPYPMVQLGVGERYGHERYRALKRLEDAGRVQLVWDRWGWSYVNTLRPMVGFGHEVHGLPFDIQGSQDYAFRCETGEREALAFAWHDGWTASADDLVSCWQADARYAVAS